MAIICRCCGTFHAQSPILPAREYSYADIRKFLGAWQGKGFQKEDVPFTLLMRLAPRDGRPHIIASVTALPCPDARNEVYLCRWKVHRMFRGQGIGRAMLQAALADAKLHHATRAYAVTQAGKAAAHVFEKLGAQRISREEILAAAPREHVLHCDATALYWMILTGK